MKRLRVGLLACVLGLSDWCGAAEPSFTRENEVIYGRKHGLAMTLDVFKPKAQPNGAGIVMVASGGWFSSRQGLFAPVIEHYTKRGYVVFGVVHGSQPRFSIPEVVQDLHRAIRFIRSKAGDYGVDPQRLGITGGSAGGHLSLMMGTSGGPGDPKAKDPVDRLSSEVQAVACFFPPTDFLNYGKENERALGEGILDGFKAPFDFVELSPTTKRYERITDSKKRVAIGKEISPVTHVTADDAPTLIVHGDADKLVPLQQSERIIERLKAVGVPTELVVKPGVGHGWPGLIGDVTHLADWFDQHLAKPE